MTWQCNWQYLNLTDIWRVHLTDYSPGFQFKLNLVNCRESRGRGYYLILIAFICLWECSPVLESDWFCPRYMCTLSPDLRRTFILCWLIEQWKGVDWIRVKVVNGDKNRYILTFPGGLKVWLTPPEMLNILSQYIYPKPAFGIYPESTNIVREFNLEFQFQWG